MTLRGLCICIGRASASFLKVEGGFELAYSSPCHWYWWLLKSEVGWPLAVISFSSFLYRVGLGAYPAGSGCIRSMGRATSAFVDFLCPRPRWLEIS